MRVIRSTYETFDEESVEAGDARERGWREELGWCMETDESDREEGIDAVDLAVSFLEERGATEPSSSEFTMNTWYTCFGEMDYRTGDCTNESYHLSGFTVAEERRIFNRVEML